MRSFEYIRFLTPTISGALIGMLIAVASLNARSEDIDVQVADDPPVYDVKDCCTLCPKADDLDSYPTTFLKDYIYLIQGDGQWLFRTQAELNKTKQKADLEWSDLKRLRDAVKARGTDFMISLTPPRALVEFSKLTEKQRHSFDSEGLLKHYVSFLQELRNAGFIVIPLNKFGANREEPYFFERDAHWTPSGARRTAELVAETIKPLGYEFTPKAYVTKVTGVNVRRGTLGFAADIVCGSRYPTQRSYSYETTAPASDDLFGDEPQPEVHLIGTSFSASPEYNFRGFLRESLQTEVLSAAFPGAGFDGSITTYLMSDTFQKSPPKLLIWEVPYQFFGRADRSILRRIVPLVENGCNNRTPLISNEIQIANDLDDFTEVLFNGGDKFTSEKSKNLVVDMKFSDTSIKEILLEFWYLDGRHELVRVRYNQYTNTDGRYVVELGRRPEYADQPMIDFRVQVLSTIDKPTKLKATLCSTAEVAKR